ncbi:hypothetical protein LDO26_02855 [Luteimonas sp. BDR2-5]|nr:hypothetical protein [Luteimonas sp. BDR2-5]
MHWIPGTRLPIPDWQAIAAAEAPACDDAQRHAYWAAAAGGWLDALGEALPQAYAQRGSKHFLLLSAQREREAGLLLRSCEQALRAIRGGLGPLASDSGFGPFVVLLFSSQDDYYDYLSHYHDDGGEHAMSSGVFIDNGYGHFASWHDALDELEAVVVHELTHALLSHLPLPPWLNEGIAVNTERTLLPRLADPRMALYGPAEMAARHAAWWNAETIQAFWSGEAFHSAGEGVELAYDLARLTTALAARDEAAFQAFVLQAHWQDAGEGAAEALGYPLAHLVAAVLGNGDWTPRVAGET